MISLGAFHIYMTIFLKLDVRFMYYSNHLMCILGLSNYSLLEEPFSQLLRKQIKKCKKKTTPKQTKTFSITLQGI